ncbi:MAG: hypothetical protein IT513_17600 [Burkholderiales bacterium]|nr:hypothetical protein [Burkholderiales bacterium]
MRSRRRFLVWSVASALAALGTARRANALQPGEAERRRHERLAAGVARSDEPWIGYYSPRALEDRMRSGGFAVAQALGAEEMNRRYFDGRADGFRLYGSGRIMAAQV